MSDIQCINAINGSVNNFQISDLLFNFFIHQSLLYKVIRALIRNSKRVRNAHYKCKSGLSGSGRKIRPQKGTGKSRQGTCKEIHMRGGAVKFGFSGNKYKDFGRRFRSYSHINKKEKQLVLFGILADRIRYNNVYLFDSELSNFSEDNENSLNLVLNVIKKSLINIFKKCSKITFVYYDKRLSKLFRNFVKVNCVYFMNLNSLEIVKTQSIIFEKQAFDYFVNCFNIYNQKKINN